MPLSKPSLKSRIEAEMVALGFTLTDWTSKFAEAIANAIVEEIQTNAETSVDGESIL